MCCICAFPPIFRMDNMKHDWPSIRKAFLIGLLLSVAGIFFVIYTGWNEAALICLIVGPFLLFCCLVLTLFSGRMVRSNASHLPEGWDTLSSEAKYDYARPRVAEESIQGNTGTRISLWLMRLNIRQRRHIESPIEKRDE
jgi:hypothetical protein